MKRSTLILLLIALAVMVAPTVNAGKQLLHDARYRERDRLAVQHANDLQYWSAFYTWQVREGATK